LGQHAALPVGGAASRCLAYGLVIKSAIPLPELVPAEGEVDVEIHLSRVDLPPEATSGWGCVHAAAEVAHLYFGPAGRFLVREGREIVVDPIPGVDERVLRTVILGPALGTLLYQRGWLPLHASSVATSGGAVAFVGEKGEGKSTMAAAMYARGHSLIADDVTAIEVADTGQPTVYPAYPQLRLWPAAAASLGDDLDGLPHLDSLSDKRGRHALREFSLIPRPLRRVYVLSRDETPRIEQLGPQEALMELVRYTYGRRLLQTVRSSKHFLKCAGVVNNVSVRRLRRPHSFAALSEVMRLVEEDCTDGGG
jgi:hypothetical protein